MSRRKCTCRHCGSPVQQVVAEVVHEPIYLPTVPRPFRVHHDGRTQDCILHPDGRMTMQVGTEMLVSMLSFDEMRASNWLHAHIEWDPPEQAADSLDSAERDAVQDQLAGIAP